MATCLSHWEMVGVSLLNGRNCSEINMHSTYFIHAIRRDYLLMYWSCTEEWKNNVLVEWKNWNHLGNEGGSEPQQYFVLRYCRIKNSSLQDKSGQPKSDGDKESNLVSKSGKRNVPNRYKKLFLKCQENQIQILRRYRWMHKESYTRDNLNMS